MDVLFLIFGVGALGLVVWAALYGGEARRTWGCKSQLKDLGAAFEKYSKDNGDHLPPAVFVEGDEKVSWDQLVAPYLVSMPRKPDATNALAVVEAKAAEFFHCPSDTEPRGGALPRSYSMPMYDIKRDSWPPEPESQGGVGLFLDAKQLAEARKVAAEGLDFVPTLAVKQIPAPADTALLVERIAIRNALWETTFACIVAPREQWDAKTIERKNFHRSRFNYLMVDGHVELLEPVQSGGHLGNGGMWSLRPGD